MRREGSGIEWPIKRVWQRKETRLNTGEGRCPLGIGEDDVKHISLDGLKTRNLRRKLLNEKWLDINKEATYWKNKEMQQYRSDKKFRKVIRQSLKLIKKSLIY